MGIWIRYRPMVIVFLLSASLGILSGCDKYSRYRALSFFFDGVPHPDEPKKKEQPTSLRSAKADLSKKESSTPEKPRFSHPPPEGKEDCSVCHGAGKRPGLPPKDMCLKCHEHLKKDRPFIHGPAVVDCIVCHNVHESQSKTLVRKIGNPLCFDCHDKENLQKGEPHKELPEADLVCLSCHDPHGGKDKFFLR
jgi:predicted CXXCH cytochrome family protein